MFSKKLPRLQSKDLKELKKKEELIEQYVNVVQALELQKQFYIKRLMPKYGLDINANYTICLKTGKIVLNKPPLTK